MKTSRLFLALALLCVAVSSCKKDDGKETPEANVAWAPSTAVSGAVSFTLGQAQSIAMTAENIDFVSVTTKPEAWTVTATPDKIDIKAPSGLEASFDLSGEIKLEANNREQGKTVPVTISVAVDESSISGKVEFTSDVVYTQVFNVGETKTFEYAASFVNDVTATAPNGWTASVDASAKTVSVTAPASFEGKVAISGEVALSAKSITGADAQGASFGVALPVYKVSAPADPAAKVYGIYDEDGNGLGILCFTSDGNFALVNGNMIPASDEAVFTSNGEAITEYEGEAQSATTSPYTVKDVDGNEYNTIYANGEIFMDSNLRVTKNPAAEDIAYQFPGMDETKADEYGLLYDQAGAFNGQDPAEGAIQGICPDGWHLPSILEVADVAEDATTADGLYGDLYASFCAKCAGMAMINPYMGTMALMIDQASSFLLTGASFLTMMPEMGAGVEFQPYNGFFMSVRCVKDSIPFAE